MFALRNALPRAGARAFSTTAPRSLAKMQLIGRLADTPAVNPTSTGRDVIRYAVGVSTGSRDENGNRGVSWFKVASFSEGPQKDLLLSLPKGTLMYIEAEAKMDSFQAQDGTQRTALNLLQRNFEALSRPRIESSSETGGPESDTDPANEPLSGVGAS
ncbi:hypothetical protein WHR41_00569 [Cladosporium halotolerans]|uniref:SsDNA binding protein n=1 Tax=Cladosporium halotolerans TaxID=1052096 RepID=A0AB34L0M0_9PEZI